MSTGPDPWGTRPVAPLRAERAPEIVVVPPGLYTLRTIVLGAAAVVGAVGLLVFVQAPDALPGPVEAAVRFQPGAAIDEAGCGQACLGRAVAVRDLDALPMVLDTEALAVVTRAVPERPWAATPPPAADRPAEAGDGERGGDGKGGDTSGKDGGKGNKGDGEDKHKGDGDD